MKGAYRHLLAGLGAPPDRHLPGGRGGDGAWLLGGPPLELEAVAPVHSIVPGEGRVSCGDDHDGSGGGDGDDAGHLLVSGLVGVGVGGRGSGGGGCGGGEGFRGEGGSMLQRYLVHLPL